MERVFKFSKDDVDGLIQRELKIPKRVKNSFNYVYDTLKANGHHIVAKKKIAIPKGESSDLIKKGILCEGKSYHWTSIDHGDISFLIRTYGTHLTIFSRQVEHIKTKHDQWSETRYAAFEIYTDTSIEYELNKRGESEFENYHEDLFYCEPFHDFNLLINNIVDLMMEGRLHILWNSASIPRPKRVKMKLYFEFKDTWSSDGSIDNIDKMIYACEELSSVHRDLYAENDVLEEIKKFKKGDNFGHGKILEVKTKTDRSYGSYHGVGITWQDERQGKKWQDVYGLTEWYLEYVFPQEEEMK